MPLRVGRSQHQHNTIPLEDRQGLVATLACARPTKFADPTLGRIHLIWDASAGERTLR